ncbi:LysE family translocator [Comamonadaceae bacterium M7527]|nr:LysE family translocator [Comamonadaceae bacterium M7527]
MNHATQQGARVAFVAGIGRQLAFVLMMALAAVGVATVLYASVWVFVGIKLAGAAYLLYLAWQLWHTKVNTLTATPKAQRQTITTLAQREFWLAMGNPKAILIFTAFLPQFVQTERAIAPQFALLGALFLLLEFVAIGLYALAGRYAAALMGSTVNRMRFNRFSAALLGLAGLGLLLARR